MKAAAKTLITFILSACTSLTAIAQIRVELLNQTIQAEYLGFGTDNYVRIHNLPAGAVVSISPGEALQVKGNEYVLCRLGVCVEKGKTATLSVALKGKTIFTKEYQLLSTPASGTVYNLILHLKLGKRGQHVGEGAGLDKQWFIYSSFLEAVVSRNHGFTTDSSIKLSESIKLCGFTVTAQGHGMDAMGPYKLGDYTKVSFRVDETDTIDSTVRSKEETMWLSLENFTKRMSHKTKEWIIFLECIRAKNDSGGTYTVAPFVIMTD